MQQKSSGRRESSSGHSLATVVFHNSETCGTLANPTAVDHIPLSRPRHDARRTAAVPREPRSAINTSIAVALAPNAAMGSDPLAGSSRQKWRCRDPRQRLRGAS